MKVFVVSNWCIDKSGRQLYIWETLSFHRKCTKSDLKFNLFYSAEYDLKQAVLINPGVIIISEGIPIRSQMNKTDPNETKLFFFKFTSFDTAVYVLKWEPLLEGIFSQMLDY